MSDAPTGQERHVQVWTGVALDGAPVAFVIVLAAVVTALSFIPFSVILTVGGSFPMAQGIYPLVGWILGPVAGAVATGVGRLIGVFVAPHTASVPLISVWSAMVGSFAAGAMVTEGRRKWWWIPLTAFFVIEWLLYAGRAIVQNGIRVPVAVAGSFIDWSGILFFALPTRALAVRWLRSAKIGELAAGLFLGTWMIAGVTHLSASVIFYFISNMAEEVWIALTPMMPVENLFRCLVGAVIGTGVITGLRAIGIIKPAEGLY